MIMSAIELRIPDDWPGTSNAGTMGRAAGEMQEAIAPTLTFSSRTTAGFQHSSFIGNNVNRQISG
jgi:hypothetical protein